MSSETVTTGFCMFYELNHRLLLLTGLWPYQERLEILFRVIVISLCFICCIILELYDFYQHEFNIETIVQHFQIFIPLIYSFAIYYSLVFQLKTMKNIVNHIASDCNQLSNENEFIIMQKYAKINKRIILSVTSITFLYGITLLFPLVSHILLYNTDDISDKQLAQLPFPIDPSLIDKKKQFLYIIVILEICAIIILSTVTVVSLTSFFFCISHACAILSIIIFKIDQPLKKNTKNLDYDWSSYATMCDAYNWVKDIVRYHVNVINFCFVVVARLVDLINAMSDKVSMLIIIFAVMSIMASSIYILHKSDLMENMKDTILYVIFILGYFLIIINNCYFGQILIDHSTKVLESLHQVSFYELPTKYQKAIIMLLMRCVKPCTILINGVFVLSLNFLARFMHTSLSYVMVYYNMR